MKLSFISTIVISFLLQISFFVCGHTSRTIAVIGTGYVGLVSGVCLAQIGNYVICADIDTRKINDLKKGVVPIYEKDLDEMVARNVLEGRLVFTDDLVEAITQADIIFIAVGTPMSDDGSADLSYIYAVVETIAHAINDYKIIVTKSTVPVGTGKKIRSILEKDFNISPDLFSIVSNPEFLREGLAISDFLQPDRLVIGAESDKSFIALCEVYEQLITLGAYPVLTDLQTAEMIKYAANAFLSIKVSYINEIANVCDKFGADVSTVAFAMGLDHRISPFFLKPGPGFGGSCFPKDSQALLHMAQQHDLPFYTVEAALQANKIQQKKSVEKLCALMKKKYNESIEGKIVAVLGLSFKANTDDVRYSPAISTIKGLQEQGAIVQAYDPVAMPNMYQLFPDIIYGKTLEEAVTGADAIIIMTDWYEIKQIDFTQVKHLVNRPIVIDMRNIVDPKKLQDLGFACDSLGHSYLCKSKCDCT